MTNWTPLPDSGPLNAKYDSTLVLLMVLAQVSGSNFQKNNTILEKISVKCTKVAFFFRYKQHRF